MGGLEHALRNDPRVQARLRHPRDRETAEAAIQFYTRRVPSPNPYWYASETWRQVTAAFHDLGGIRDAIWQSSDNNDHSTLKTWDTPLQVGQVVEIEGEERLRCVTGTMGSPDRYHAYFRGQGAVPTGSIRWRVVADAPPASTEGGKNGTDGPGKGEDDDRPPDPNPGPGSMGLLDQLRRHPAIGSLTFLGAVIVGLGSLTDALDRIIQFLRKYAGW